MSPNIENINKLLEFFKDLDEKHFDMSVYMATQNTFVSLGLNTPVKDLLAKNACGCIAGWAIALLETEERKESMFPIQVLATELLFNLDKEIGEFPSIAKRSAIYYQHNWPFSSKGMTTKEGMIKRLEWLRDKGE